MGGEDAAAKGVEEAWAFWLSQHPISVQELIEEAVRKEFRAWLFTNEDKVIAAIAKAASRRGGA